MTTGRGSLRRRRPGGSGVVASLPLPGTGREVAQTIAIAVAYFVTARLSLSLAIPPGYATAVWPAAGIALASVLIAGARVWPGIWLGAAASNLLVQGSPFLAAIIATGNSLEAVIAAALVERYADGGRLDHGEPVVRFVGLCGLSAGVAAGIGVSALALGGALPIDSFLPNLWTWWQGDASAMIIVTPLILSWHTAGWPRFSPARALEAIALGLALSVTAFLVFGGLRSDSAAVSLAFLTLPFIIWAAIRYGPRGVTTCTALLCAIAIWHALRGGGLFGPDSTNVSLLFLLTYACTLSITGLVLNSVIRERDRANAELREGKAQLAQRVDERSQEIALANRALRRELVERGRHEETLRQNEERFRLVVDGVKDHAIFFVGPDGRVVSWNKGAENIYGYPAKDAIGSHLSRFATPEDMARDTSGHALALARVAGRHEHEGWRVRKDGTRFWADAHLTALYDNDGQLRGFAKITRDLTARRRLEALQENEQQMNEFLAMLGHELRNPLAAIVNALGLMHGRDSARRGDELKAIIDRQATHLSRLVDDLLDVSRITRGLIALRKEILDLNQVVSGAVASCRPQIEARRQELSLELAPEEVPVDADPTRLAQIVVNLVSNALKYTPEGGRITVAVARESGRSVVRVRDTGVGIAPELRSRVFDLFVQGQRSLDRVEGGLGIGLTIVKRLVELHDGTVSVDSAGVGQGSEFIVSLPLAARAPAASTALSVTADAPPRARKDLLVVDDNRDAANTLAALLETMGHEVRTAYCGSDAISLAVEQPPDAVFLDIGLPGLTGYDVARTLRAAPAMARTRLIAFTGYGHDEDRRRVHEAGFDHHLVKPVAAAELARIVDALPSRQ
jgi:PAS domain S-box-containing protein